MRFERELTYDLENSQNVANLIVAFDYDGSGELSLINWEAFDDSWESLTLDKDMESEVDLYVQAWIEREQDENLYEYAEARRVEAENSKEDKFYDEYREGLS